MSRLRRLKRYSGFERKDNETLSNLIERFASWLYRFRMESTTKYPKIFVSIKTEDEIAGRLLQQIEKLSLLWLWVNKANALLEAYLAQLHAMDHIKDPVMHGKMIQDCESYFMSSVGFFLRCFLDQPTLHLEIKQITENQNLRNCYDEIMTLRNDEFVHWKGVRSKIEVRYSFETIDEKSADFGREFNISFSESIGPGQQAEPMKELYLTTVKYIEQRREKVLNKLRTHLQRPEVFQNTLLLNEFGESIIKKT